MPKGDRTGPSGQGSRTGREFGFCRGYNSPGYKRGPEEMAGRRFGREGGGRRQRNQARNIGSGRGMGMGFGHGRNPGKHMDDFTESPWLSPKDEISLLEIQADYLEQKKKIIEKRLNDLKDHEEESS